MRLFTPDVGLVPASAPKVAPVGYVQAVSNGRIVREYMADGAILCGVCGCLITPHSAFTVVQIKAAGGSQHPACWVCRPFRVGRS